MAVTQYIGARYVPIFADKAWNSDTAYEPLTIVLHNGNSYTSRQYVPAGVEIENEDYWAETGNYNAQIEAYRKEVLDFSSKIDSAVKDAADAKSQVEGASAKADSAQAKADAAQAKADSAYKDAQTANASVSTEKSRAVAVENTAIKSLSISNNSLSATTIGGATTTIGNVGGTDDFLHEYGVLCLGDSFGSENDKISGRGYWTTYLRNQLKSETGISNLPFYNYCVSGYGFNNVSASANDASVLPCTYTNAHSFYNAAVSAYNTLKATTYNGQNVANNIGHVVIFGGYNDIDRMPDIVKDTTLGNQLKTIWESNVKNTIEKVHTYFPRARIHLIPFNWPSKAISAVSLKYMVEQVAKATYDSRLCILSYYDILAEVASKYTYCDLVPYAWTWLLGRDDCISSDALHPNANGGQVIASYIASAIHGYTPIATREEYVAIGESYGIYLTMNGNTVTADISTSISSYQQPTLPKWCFASRSVPLFAYIGSIAGQVSVIRPAMFFFASEGETFQTWDSSTSSEFVTGGNYGMCYGSATWQVG